MGGSVMALDKRARETEDWTERFEYVSDDEEMVVPSLYELALSLGLQTVEPLSTSLDLPSRIAAFKVCL